LAVLAKDIHIYDMRTGQSIQHIRSLLPFPWNNFSFADILAFSPDSQYLVTGQQSGVVSIWSIQSGTQTDTFMCGDPGGGALAFSPDGKTMAIGCTKNTVLFVDAQSGQLQRQIIAGNDITDRLRGFDSSSKPVRSIQSIAFRPDGTRVVVASNDGHASVWNMVTGDEVCLLTGHTNVITDAQYSPDGSFIVTTGYDSHIKIWRDC
jgi:eukaryotic-like serine/threonine-protein kinase